MIIELKSPYLNTAPLGASRVDPGVGQKNIVGRKTNGKDETKRSEKIRKIVGQKITCYGRTRPSRPMMHP